MRLCKPYYQVSFIEYHVEHCIVSHYQIMQEYSSFDQKTDVTEWNENELELLFSTKRRELKFQNYTCLEIYYWKVSGEVIKLGDGGLY